MVETMVSEQTEVSIHTAGGRLHPLDELDALLGAGYPYLVFEPQDLPDGLRERIVGAGYMLLFVNTQGELFVAFGGG
jgi:hypothetical protein